MTSRPRQSYLLRAGEFTLMLPPRIAALVERRTNIRELRLSVRGIDPEASAVLEDLRTAALSWSGSLRETDDDKPREPPSELITSGGAADVTGISRQAIGKAIRSGRLSAQMVNGRYLIRRDDLEHWRATRPR